MVDLTSIAAVTTSLKAAGDIAKAAVGLSQAEAIRGKVLDLQSEISSALGSAVSAYTDQLALLERVRGLEGKIADLEAWSAKKERYELCERVDGVFAYRLKDGVQPPEPSHYICETCYQQSIPSILQKKVQGAFETQFCPRCKTEIRIAAIERKIPTRPVSRGGW